MWTCRKADDKIKKELQEVISKFRKLEERLIMRKVIATREEEQEWFLKKDSNPPVWMKCPWVVWT